MYTSCRIAQTSVMSISNVQTNSGFQCHFGKTVGLFELKKKTCSSMHSNRKTHSSHYCTGCITVFIVFLVCLFFLNDWMVLLKPVVVNRVLLSEILWLTSLNYKAQKQYYPCFCCFILNAMISCFLLWNFFLELIVLSNFPTQLKAVQLMMCFIGDWLIFFLFSSFLNLLCK